MTVQIAPGVKYNTWSFSGHGAPGPILHVRQGQLVKMTLTNGGTIPHSIDFHAARIAPNLAFRDVDPGKSFSFQFRAERPGRLHVPLRDEAGADAHRERDVRRDRRQPDEAAPAGRQELRSRRQRVVHDHRRHQAAGQLRHGQGARDGAGLDDVQRVREPVRHPSADRDPGQTVRLWVVAAGPTLDTDFHVVGTIFDRAWPNANVTGTPQHGVQTVQVPAGGGGVFDVKIDQPGLYPFVSHAFAHVDLGQVGLLKIGNPPGTMSH